MIRRHIPNQLHPTPGCHPVTEVEAGRLAFLAGECPIDAAGRMVGPDDVFAQRDQVALDALTAQAGGARGWPRSQATPA
jgi:hypothetical protein